MIRGGTPHFEYVCQAATDGLSRVAVDTGVPVGFGVLTCDDEQQALDRAGLDGLARGQGPRGRDGGRRHRGHAAGPGGHVVTTTVAERFVDAFARRDRAALLDLFTPEVDFRGMTPGRFWEAIDRSRARRRRALQLARGAGRRDLGARRRP